MAIGYQPDIYLLLAHFLVPVVPKTGQLVLGPLKIGTGQVVQENIVLAAFAVVREPPFLDCVLPGVDACGGVVKSLRSELG